MKLLTICVVAMTPCALAGQDSSVINSPQNTTSQFDLVITEIMADPDPTFGLPEAEFVEILNRSESPVNLSGWILYDGSTRVLPNIDLMPQQYLIICANADTLNFVQYGNVAGVSSLSLTNGGEKIAIRNAMGLPVDSVIYSDSWHGNSYKKDGGWSLERIDTDFTCAASENWKSSKNASGGTPGTINSVNGTFIDDTAPVMLRAYCPDSASVMIIFSEALDPLTSTSIQNYTLTTTAALISAEMADLSNTSVLLHFSEALIADQVGFIRAIGPGDCAGNMVDPNNMVKFGIADTGLNPKIIINELLFNPFEGGYDFVEIYNCGNKITDLSKFQIASINLTTGEIENAEFISEDPWMIFPGDYFVISEKPDQVALFYRSPYPYNFVQLDNIPSMNIDEGHIAILSNGNVIDQIKYSEDFHFPLIENTKGVSLEKINPFRNAMDPGAWHSASTSSGYATPGFRNSQFAEIVPAEKNVTVNPEIFSPDQDGTDDVITFNLATDAPGYISKIIIYNSSGYVIFEDPGNSLLGTSDFYSWNGISTSGEVSQPGIYVAIIEIFNLEGEVQHFKLPFVLAIKL